MSEAAEKPFDATPTRIAKAKREGNVMRSLEFGANAAFVCAAATTVAVVPALGAVLQSAIVRAARGGNASAGALLTLALALTPMAAGAIGGSVAALIQSGGLQINAVVLKLERLAPAAGLRKMFSRDAAVHAVRATAAVAIAAACTWPSMRELYASALQHASVARIAATAWIGTQRMVAAIAVLGFAFAFAEFGVARRQWLQKLRMSFEEYKRERKEQDGDPTSRARRRALHRSLGRGAVARVKDATFVVANPTHVAIALEYRPPAVSVPTVVVRAADDVAQRVRALALDYGVPIVENVALARALYRDARVGVPIPLDHYIAVAEVVTTLVRSGALGPAR